MSSQEPRRISAATSLQRESVVSSRSRGSSHLDANTPRGRDAIRWARKGAIAFLRAYPTLRLAETDQDEPADIDGILYSMMDTFNTIKGVLEIKTRYMTHEKLMGPYNGEWLITKNKIDRGIATAKSLKCPFIGLMVLPNSMLALSRLIADKDGNIMCKMREEVTETSASVNGGKMTGLNAFIQMDDAKQFKL